MTLARMLTSSLLAAALAFPASAQVIEVKQFSIESAEEAYVLNADFEVDLTSRVEEALNSGVPLIFVVEFELTRPRWYWFDEKAASSRLEARLSYNPLLRQYRVSTGPLQRNYSAVADARAALAQLRGWPVLERERVLADTGYVASLRMRLDTTQLPKPFQITALTDRDWNLASPWKRMSFLAAEAERVAR
jgi:hypothetical protein